MSGAMVWERWYCAPARDFAARVRITLDQSESLGYLPRNFMKGKREP